MVLHPLLRPCDGFACIKIIMSDAIKTKGTLIVTLHCKETNVSKQEEVITNFKKNHNKLGNRSRESSRKQKFVIRHRKEIFAFMNVHQKDKKQQ